MRSYGWLLAALLFACGDDASSEEEPEERDAAAPRDASMGDASTLDARVPALGDASSSRDAGSPGDASSSSDSSSSDAAAERDAMVDAGSEDVARALDGLILESPCAADTPLPLAQGATCLHANAKQRLTVMKKLGGDPTRVYEVRLRIRGIWEPTSIAGGMHDAKLPLTVGGEVAQGAGDPINYQQWFIQVAKPKQTYWLNDYRYVAHDIHREDYEATLRIQGGSDVTLVMNDGNERQIANWTKDTLDGGAPATGQVLRVDVLD